MPSAVKMMSRQHMLLLLRVLQRSRVSQDTDVVPCLGMDGVMELRVLSSLLSEIDHVNLGCLFKFDPSVFFLTHGALIIIFQLRPVYTVSYPSRFTCPKGI